ncbi:hypothetical protein TNCT_509641 [Trichonephila clavata]|uniref:Uncharacterized protein n=1 Tax=Trichonephila clavata TaxID=2740835 RepID=A0A8X6JIM4_TRICU|nr:hypothetical protein TNCT_509641 [Trichonephila clavata]
MANKMATGTTWYNRKTDLPSPLAAPFIRCVSTLSLFVNSHITLKITIVNGILPLMSWIKVFPTHYQPLSSDCQPITAVVHNNVGGRNFEHVL